MNIFHRKKSESGKVWQLSVHRQLQALIMSFLIVHYTQTVSKAQSEIPNHNLKPHEKTKNFQITNHIIYLINLMISETVCLHCFHHDCLKTKEKSCLARASSFKLSGVGSFCWVRLKWTLYLHTWHSGLSCVHKMWHVSVTILASLSAVHVEESHQASAVIRFISFFPIHRLKHLCCTFLPALNITAPDASAAISSVHQATCFLV